MKVDLNVNHRGEWQADIVMPDGGDHHAVGRSPGRALMELGSYLESLPKPRDTDMQTLGKVLAGRTPSPTKPGNVRCMDCRCGGFDCPGMPAGYEDGLIRDWSR